VVHDAFAIDAESGLQLESAKRPRKQTTYKPIVKLASINVHGDVHGGEAAYRILPGLGNFETVVT
jgi:hypothetical protein